jgi:hypothetical protein
VMAAALLLRAMPEPSTPEGRRVRQGLRGLLEQAVVQNAESSASQSHSTRRRGERPLLTRHQQYRVCHPLTHKGATGPRQFTSASEPTRTYGPPSRPGDVTGTRPSPDVTDRAEAGGTTPITTEARHQSLRVPASSARPYAGPSSLRDSDSPPTSSSTQEKLTLSSGWRITAWHAS